MNSTGKKCCICKSKVKFFNTVFLEFDGEGDVHDVNETEEQSGNNGVHDLQAEWEGVFRELKGLLSCEDSETDKYISSDVVSKRNETRDDFQGTQDVRDICATIDLTQSPCRASSTINLGSDSESEAEPAKPHADLTSRVVHAKSDVELEDDDDLKKAQEIEQQQLRKSRISSLLTRLHEIHTTLMDLAPSNTKSQLKSKYLSLQKTNAALQSDLDAFHDIQITLQSQLNQAKQSLLDRNIEAERERRKHHQSDERYARLLEQYSSYQSESKREITGLRQSNLELKRNYDQLKTTSGLEDVGEMREITEKYRKMSQEVYDLKKENRVLKRRIEERERRRNEMEKIRVEVGLNRVDGGKENVRSEREDDSRKSGYNMKSDNPLMKKNNNSNRAMDILDSAPSRKSAPKNKGNNFSHQQKQRYDQNKSKRSQIRDISRFCHDEYSSDSDSLDVQMFPKSKKQEHWEDDRDSSSLDVQLFLKPKKSSRSSIRPASSSNQNTTLHQRSESVSKAIPLQRNDSNNTGSNTIGTKRAFAESATLSKNKLLKRGSSQTISSFFRPVER